MSTLTIGLLYGGATLVVLFSGMPIAFALGSVAVVFMAFFMPGAHAEIDWSRGYESLDKELQQLVREAEQGRCARPALSFSGETYRSAP